MKQSSSHQSFFNRIDKKQLIAFFDQISQNYQNSFTYNKQAKQKLLFLIDKWQIKTKQKILEIGCGKGDLSTFIWQTINKKGDLTLLDFSKKMIDFAQKKFFEKYPQDYPKIQFVNDDIEQVDLGQLFDRIIIFNTFPHLQNKLNCLLNCRRHLSQTGQIIICHNHCRQTIQQIHQNKQKENKHLNFQISEFPNIERLKKIFLLTELKLIEFENNLTQDYYLIRLKQ